MVLMGGFLRAAFASRSCLSMARSLAMAAPCADLSAEGGARSAAVRSRPRGCRSGRASRSRARRPASPRAATGRRARRTPSGHVDGHGRPGDAGDVLRLRGEVRVERGRRRVAGGRAAPAALILAGAVGGAAQVASSSARLPDEGRAAVEVAQTRAPALRPRGAQRASISPSGKPKGATADGPASARWRMTLASSDTALWP